MQAHAKDLTAAIFAPPTIRCPSEVAAGGGSAGHIITAGFSGSIKVFANYSGAA